MVRCHGTFSEQHRQMMRNALRQSPRVYENECGAIFFNQPGDARIDFFPHSVRSHGPEFACRHFDRQIDLPALRNMHQYWLRSAIANQKLAYEIHGLLRGRKTNSGGRLCRQCFKTLKRKRQMRSTFVVGDRVNFVHNHRLDGAQQFAALARGQQNIKRLRRCDQDMRGPLLHGAAFSSGRIAGSHRCANFRHQKTLSLSQLENLAERFVEVSLYIVPKRLQR